MSLREYVITLRDYESLDSFYEDMETPGGTLYIPDRAIEVFNRRPISRNTHYMLTAEEAAQIKNDPRVLDIELSMTELEQVFRPLTFVEESAVEVQPNWAQTSDYYDKSNTISSAMINWALLRCTEGVQRANWGQDGTGAQAGTVTTTSSGKNVDVVIVDGHIDPTHPEFAVNVDGSGGSRVIQYNWFQHTAALGLGSDGTYIYTPYVDDLDNQATSDNNHGCHVAGTVAGNRQGWARDANIYNINPYGTNPNGYAAYGYFIDYVRYWHRNKPINPVTGIKNPTVTNHSYGLSNNIALGPIDSIRYQGSIINSPSSSVLSSCGVYNDGNWAYFPVRSVAFEADFIDAIADGIIVVAAAGNDYTKSNVYSADVNNEYNDYLSSYNGYAIYYYHRGGISQAEGVISVGAVGSYVNDSKASFSNCGPAIDIYAPGRWITSSYNSMAGVPDPRNPSYYLAKISGTSMASPQVCGVLACIAEQWPTMTQTQALDYLLQHTKTNQMTDTAGGPTDYFALQGSPNRYLYYHRERPTEGELYPRKTQGARPSSGMVFPRPKIYSYGR